MHFCRCWLNVGVLSGGAHPVRWLVGLAAGTPGGWPFFVSGDGWLPVCRMTAGDDFAGWFVIGTSRSWIFCFADSFSFLPISAVCEGHLGHTLPVDGLWQRLWGVGRGHQSRTVRMACCRTVRAGILCFSDSFARLPVVMGAGAGAVAVVNVGGGC